MTGRAALMAVGTELLHHGRSDTNGEEIARMLEARGIETDLRLMIVDDVDAIARAVQWASQACGLVSITGGIGPTLDDVTRDAVARAFDLPLVRDDEEEERLAARERGRGRVLTPTAARQADFPAGSEQLPNPIGTARGFLLRRPGDRLVIALPGVPAEMRRMMIEEALPRVAALQAAPGWKGVVADRSVTTRCLKAAGLTEAEVQERLVPLFSDGPSAVNDAARGPDLTILSAAGEITFLARGRQEQVAAVIARAREALGEHVFTETPDEHLEQVVGRLLDERGETVAVAESCTGGLLMGLVTSVPGSSRWFDCGWVTYADAAKERVLSVPAGDLEAHGAVSEPVALAMAAAARRLAVATWGLSITGIAGPDGGTEAKPVGLIWIGLAWDGGARSHRLNLSGNRETIRLIASRVALEVLRRRLRAA